VIDPAYAFAAFSLDRASERREDDGWLAQARGAATARRIVVRRDGKLLVAPGGAALSYLPLDELRDELPFLGLLGDAPLFLHALADLEVDALREALGAELRDPRALAATLPPGEAGLSAYARSLLHWQSRKRFCGRCGSPTRFEAAGHRARCTDPGCNQEYFPRTDPAIITIVHDRDACLLGRQAGWPEHAYSTLAGFVEPGETLEHAVAREVREETGVVVEHARYRGSQPWPFPASIMLGFDAAAVTREVAVGSELAEARWFEAAEMPDLIARGELRLSPRISIAFHLIDGWYHERTGGHLTAGESWRR
jgi:NAD+ diphosphatase